MRDIQYHVRDLAGLIGEPCPDDGGGILITGMASLSEARAGSIAFFDDVRQLDALRSTQASLVILANDHVNDCPVASWPVSEPRLVYAKISQLFAYRLHIEAGVHASVVCADDVSIGSDVCIAPNCVIGQGVSIAAGVRIGPGCVIKKNARIGNNVGIGGGGVIGEICVAFLVELM